MLSTRACHDASMTLPEAPTVLHRRSPSVDSTSTRTTAFGAGPNLVHYTHLVIGQMYRLQLGVRLEQPLTESGVESVHGAVPFRPPCA